MKVPKWIFLLLTIVPLLSFGQNVSYQRLLDADKEPQNWLMYNGDFASQRFSRLKQINKDTVANLRPAWIYEPSRTGFLQASPIVVDGIMYIVEVPDTVTALDARTGTKIWSWTPVLKDKAPVGNGFGPGQTSRGVAILGDTLFIGTLDARLVALDAKTGAVRWDSTVVQTDTYANAYMITGAPLVANGRVMIGVGGGEGPIRGFVDAYDVKNGERLWRVWTIPTPGDPGYDSWSGTSPPTGGATWNRGSYDPELNLIYVGTGNPSPDYNGLGRVGDDLYTCSMIAIDVTTGKVKWHFQFSPHDTHDWDAVETPVLFDATIEGKPRKLLAQANRNGFYYLLDRETGKFIAGAPFVKQTWAKGLDENGRPIQAPDNEPSAAGTTIYPAVTGGTNWFSPSFDPDRKLFFVNAREMGAVFLLGKEKFDPNVRGGGGGFNALSGDAAYGAIRALDAMTGKMKWEFRMRAPSWNSVLSTAGGLVFGQSDEGDFFALDSDTGKPLWHFAIVGPEPRAQPITYEAEGKQYVITAGTVYTAFSLTSTK
jgi:alcohol dehydrogenase (cytochrome c)